MIKCIQIADLRIGMFVHEFSGQWVDHPFWRSRFLLRSAEELNRVVDGKVQDVWIDTVKGLDVASAEVEPPAMDMPQEEVRAVAPIATSEPSTRPAATTYDAFASAKAIYKRAIPQIANLFSEARLGNAVNAQGCVAIVDEISESVLRNPGALISVARLKNRDEYTYMHSVAVCAFMVALGQQLGLKGAQLREAGLAGMLPACLSGGHVLWCEEGLALFLGVELFAASQSAQNLGDADRRAELKAVAAVDAAGIEDQCPDALVVLQTPVGSSMRCPFARNRAISSCSDVASAFASSVGSSACNCCVVFSNDVACSSVIRISRREPRICWYFSHRVRCSRLYSM